MTRAVRAMDVSMSSALLLCFVSRCRSGSAKIEQPVLSDNCAGANPRPFSKIVISSCDRVGRHGYTAFSNLA